MATQRFRSAVARRAGALAASAPAVASAALAAAALGYAAHHVLAHSARTGATAFRLTAQPAALQIAPGATARYQIAIVRPRHAGALQLRVQVPRYLHVELSADGHRGSAFDPGRGRISRGSKHHRPAPHSGLWMRVQAKGKSATLTVRADASAKPGVYALRLQGVSGSSSVSLGLKLSIAAPSPVAFTVAGDVQGLMPGTAQPVDLSLTNPNPAPISVSGLSVAVSALTAPQATANLPCLAQDFAVAQFSGGYPLTVPAHATVTLSDLAVPAAQWPRVTMLDSAADQDGCQGARLSLTYGGTATSS